jgi:hypothetical protein
VRAANVVRLGQVEALSMVLLRNSKWENGDLSLSLSLCFSVCRSLLCNCGMQWRKQKTTMLIYMGIEEEGAKEM